MILFDFPHTQAYHLQMIILLPIFIILVSLVSLLSPVTPKQCQIMMMTVYILVLFCFLWLNYKCFRWLINKHFISFQQRYHTWFLSFPILFDFLYWLSFCPILSTLKFPSICLKIKSKALLHPLLQEEK